MEVCQNISKASKMITRQFTNVSQENPVLFHDNSQLFCFRTKCTQNKTFEKVLRDSIFLQIILILEVVAVVHNI